MAESYDLILKGGTVMTPWGACKCDVGVRQSKIAALGDLGSASAEQVLDVGHLHVLPGVIDSQVHFRDPGLTHKEDIETGSRAAALGGVTTYFEMPNTKPSTTTAERLADKVARGREASWVDFAFFVGAADENAEQLAELERAPGCSGVKVFMGSSTGSLLVDRDDVLERVLASGRRRVAIHSEDEARLVERRHLVERAGATAHLHPEWRDVETALRSTQRLLPLARKHGRPVHVLHVTTRDELPLLTEYRDVATVEVTPQHLTLHAPDCYDRLGTRAQMNPPIRSEEHRTALWRAVAEGLVDVVGSDHAPHTLEEKSQAYPASPSGMPGVQTLLTVLLSHVAAGRLSLERLVDLTAHGPQRVFGLVGKGRIALGYDADFTLVDTKLERTIEQAWLGNRSAWSPFEGLAVRGWPVATIVRGAQVMRDGELLGNAAGQPARFVSTLRPQ